MAKTTFQCLGALGTYEGVVMPFELKNVGATYQQVMISMLHDFIEIFMQVCINDIVIKSSSESGHLDHLRQSFERMRKYELKINQLKCAFCVSASDFLGFVVHKKGIKINQNKMKVILNTEPPTTKKKLHSLLGKINFLKRFMSNMSGKTKVSSPLLHLKKEKVFKRESEHQRAFNETKECLSKPHVLLPL